MFIIVESRIGLDGVELIMAMEEEFDIDLQDDELARTFTVGEFFELIKRRLHGTTPGGCLSHHMFNKIRRALVNNYKLKRSQIKLNKRILDIVPEKDLKEGWPYLQLFEDLKIPELEFKRFCTGWSRDTTIADLAQMLVAMNGDSYRVLLRTDDDIWIRYVKVIQKQLNIPIGEIRVSARFGDDLGVD